MKKTISIILLLFTMIIAACDDTGKPKEKMNAKRHIAKLDSDKDGRISFVESAAYRKRRFSEFDTNQDGYIRESEIKSEKKSDNKKKFNKLDSDSDNQISLEEWMAQLERSFKISDTNLDGFITEDEVEIKQSKKKRIAKFDTDKDKKISFEEWMSKRKKRFSRLDKDNDGVIQKNEMKSKKMPGSGGRFRTLDTNDDNRLTMDEWLAPSEINFKKVDRNQDGFLSQSELEVEKEKKKK